MNPEFSIPKNSMNRSYKRKFPLKTYQVTNDEQRFRLISEVIGSQKLTIREVIN